MIPYESLQRLNAPFMEEIKEVLSRVAEGGWYILGKHVEMFEEEFARWCGRKYCIGVANGLDALTISLKAFDFEPGSEVIVPSNTYIATILSILHCGFKPVLVEPDMATYNIDPKKIEAAITPKTRAVMVVHLYGKTCAMHDIMALAKKRSLRVIEDCAQSHASMENGVLSGAFGDFGAFSFYPTKNLGALGDAGAIVTDDEKLATTVRKLRNYGSAVKYKNDLVGYNSRLDEMQAAVLSVKLRRLDEVTKKKRHLASIYFKNLSRKDYVLPDVRDDFFDVYHIFNVRHRKRDELKTFLLEKKIGTEVHYPIAPHKQTAMLPYLPTTGFPISEEIHATTLSLPISFAHTDEEVQRVAAALNEFAAR